MDRDNSTQRYRPSIHDTHLPTSITDIHDDIALLVRLTWWAVGIFIASIVAIVGIHITGIVIAAAVVGTLAAIGAITTVTCCTFLGRRAEEAYNEWIGK